MIRSVEIRNFKSIAWTSLSLGNVNVFVGANGSGKSNILEAIGMAASERSCQIEVNMMMQKGIRIAKPDLMKSSFEGRALSEMIELKFNGTDGEHAGYSMFNPTPSDIYSTWGVTFSSGAYKKSAPDVMDGIVKKSESLRNFISKYLIYSLSVNALRGFTSDSMQYPLGINGEGLDVLLNNLPKEEIFQIKDSAKEYIDWIEDIFFDGEEVYKMQGYKLGRSKSNLYFRDKFMCVRNNLFSAENANEGALELLFYLTLFVSKKTPPFFAIDNIETGLNPRLCRFLMKKICELAVRNEKQVLITTHNPAVLDGLNLNDNAQRLYVVKRNDEGETCVKRIQTKAAGDRKMMLSEMWMKGLIGGVPDKF
ncbi:MAG: AAA family ATPase [Candidatus Phocaeicola excrementipullorum]|uniref:AAA family ATPase n=1 Tax=Candidatus Phocaeicola excrementipullorum TaxID=2838731 RepID=A0A948TPE1_9BACT|nr:AAA family ATPase [Candidatus Phocaeicola excrementipullorum]